MRIHLAVRILRLAVAVGLLPILGLTAKACAPTCVSGSIGLRADGGWDWLKEPGGPLAEAKRPVGPKPRKGSGKKDCSGPGKKADSKKEFGASGPPIQSKTIYNGKVRGFTYRLDVENHKPGKRPASIHVQIKEPGKWSKYKWEYNRSTGSFDPDRKTGKLMPGAVRKDLDTDEGQEAIKDAYRALGEKKG